MSDEARKPRKRVHELPADVAAYTAPYWLSNEQLENLLLSAQISASRAGGADAAFAQIDAYFAEDGDETEAEYRRSLVRLLADLHPDLAELIGGPRCGE